MSDVPILAGPGLSFPNLAAAPVEQLGGKGANLTKIPPDWVPATLSIPTSAHRNAEIRTAPIRLDSRLVEEEAIRQLGALSATSRVLVRSSAFGEELSSRGRFRSDDVEATYEAVVGKVQELWAEVADGPEISLEMGYLLQPLRVSPIAWCQFLRGSRRRRRRRATVGSPMFPARSKAEIPR